MTRKPKRPIHPGIVDGTMFIPALNGRGNVTSRRVRIVENPNSRELVIDDRIFKNGAPMPGMGLQIGLSQLDEWNRVWNNFYNKAKQLMKNQTKDIYESSEKGWMDAIFE